MIAGVQLYNLLSPLVDGKVYPLFVTELDERDPPFIVYQVISDQPETTLDGITGHEWVNVQIDVYHPDVYQCTLLANKVINQINNNVKPSKYNGSDQLYEADAELFRISIDYGLWQTTPTI